MKITGVDIDQLEVLISAFAETDLSEEATEALADFLLNYDSLDCGKLIDIISNAREFGNLMELYEFYVGSGTQPSTTRPQDLQKQLEKEFGIIVIDTDTSLLVIE